MNRLIVPQAWNQSRIWAFTERSKKNLGLNHEERIKGNIIKGQRQGKSEGSEMGVSLESSIKIQKQ